VLGESCNADPDGGTANGGCCSSLCRNGVCAKAYYCQPNGDICHWNAECCGNVCSVNDGGVGRCLKITGSGGGGCTQEGNPCTDGAGCCSRTCFDPGSGARVCLPAGGCRLTGTSCDNDDACCGGGVNPNGTVRCSNGRCDNGQACNGVGNICSRAYLPDGGIRMINAPTNCCNGGPGNGLDVCKLDSSGIPRCFGGYSSQCPTGYTGQAPCCIAADEPCQLSGQCCDGRLCLPVDGGYRCTAPTCTRLGDACTMDSECCAGTFCIQGACRPGTEMSGDGGTTDAGVLPDGGMVDAGVVCIANGQSCQFSAQCCSQICNNGTCAPPVTCQPQGAVCSSAADCCSGTACVITSGTTGTCQPNSCVGAGQSCSAGGTSCCAGLACLNSAYQPCGASGQCTCTVIIN
jgi:hypothetical protein